MRQRIIRTGLETLYFTGAHRALRGMLGGVGAILTMHHVRPPRPYPFQPNRLLEITPDFLENVIHRVRRSGLSLVSLDEAHRRLTSGDFSERFACLTFDDGYRDNVTYAYPILKRLDVPFTIYIPTSFPDGIGDLWWLTLEAVIARTDYLSVRIGGTEHQFESASPAAKQDVFAAIYWRLRDLDCEDALRATVNEMAVRYGVDPGQWARSLCLTWEELRALAADPLVTIGAHTVNHVMLRKQAEETVRSEMAMSARVIEAELGRRPDHFSYPVGDPTSAGPREFAIARELGFKTAVTTRPGVLFPDHAEHLTALPRISLNGEFQRLRYVDVLTSGAATALFNRLRRVDAA